MHRGRRHCRCERQGKQYGIAAVPESDIAQKLPLLDESDQAL